MTVPENVWNTLLIRADDQIGMQELLAVPLGLETFSSVVAGTLLTVYIDNDGVLGGILRGSSVAADLNQAIGFLWLDIAKAGIGVHCERVESHANIADGPSREFLSLVEELGAVFVEPKLPTWCHRLWEFPVSVEG